MSGKSMDRWVISIGFSLLLLGCTSSMSRTPTLFHATRLPMRETEISHPSQSTELSTPELIEAALAREEISEGQRFLYLAYAIYEPDSLPDQFRSDHPWRGTLIVRELNQMAGSREIFCALPQETQQEIRRLMPDSVECLP